MSGEADAVKADAIVSRVASDLSASQLPGYLKVNRKVCKSEWAYEYEIIFSDLDNFKAYMGSDVRTKQVACFGRWHMLVACLLLLPTILTDAAALGRCEEACGGRGLRRQ